MKFGLLCLCFLVYSQLFPVIPGYFWLFPVISGYFRLFPVIPGYFSVQYETLQIQVLNLYVVLHRHLLDDRFTANFVAFGAFCLSSNNESVNVEVCFSMSWNPIEILH